MVSAKDDEPVKDRYNSTLILFYCLGVLTQINVFISNAQLYWKYKFRDINKKWDPNDSNQLQNEFTSDFATVSQVAGVVGLIAAVMLVKKFSITSRMVTSFCGLIMMFATLTVFAVVDTSTWQTVFLYMTMFFCFLITMVSCNLMVPVFQLCAKFLPKYFAAVMSGGAVAGVLSSIVQILTLLVDGSPSMNGIVYFSVAIIFVVLTFLAFSASVKYSSYFEYYSNQMIDERIRQARDVKITKQLIYMVVRKQMYFLGALTLVCLATGMVQPGITSTVESVDADNGTKWNKILFMPVVTFFVYNVFDFIGREIAIRMSKPIEGIPIFLFSIARLILPLLLMMCNLKVKQNTAIWFKSDIVFSILMILFGLSDGYGTNICIISILRNRGDGIGELIITVTFIVAIMFGGNAIASLIELAIVNVL
ncbi:hypothetical protein HHI36_009329 [Cryptolaemus montrouzieri]|uniref:Equilibrative nucleoside transporter 3 n=1 Tax=Cryptolaemus montrouzieri TaxID=559131 RepID=A0ABD2MVU4_9CUCU